MKTLSQDSSVNDISITSSGDFSMEEGIDAYGIILADAVRTVLGEIQLDTSLGIDYFGTVFDNVNGVPEWRLAVRKTLESYDFVKNVGNIEVTIDNTNKKLSYSVTVTTDLGEVEVED